MKLWRDLLEPGHWVVQTKRRLLHFYDWSRPRSQHFYNVAITATNFEMNDWDEEFRRVV